MVIQGITKWKISNAAVALPHIRRYFFDAISKGKQRNISYPAVQGVEYCDKLFAYERRFEEKGCSYKQLKNGRLKHEKPSD